MAGWIVSGATPHFCAPAGHPPVVFDVRPNWNRIKVARMRWVLRMEFRRTDRYLLWQSLMDTGDATLIEKSNMDGFWGKRQERNEEEHVRQPDRGAG